MNLPVPIIVKLGPNKKTVVNVKVGGFYYVPYSQIKNKKVESDRVGNDLVFYFVNGQKLIFSDFYAEDVIAGGGAKVAFVKEEKNKTTTDSIFESVTPLLDNVLEKAKLDPQLIYEYETVKPSWREEDALLPVNDQAHSARESIGLGRSDESINAESLNKDAVAAPSVLSTATLGFVVAGLGAGAGAGAGAVKNVETFSITLKGKFTAGPAVDGNDLKLFLYDQSGSIRGEADVNEDGSYQISISNYEGLVFIKIVSTHTGVDYYDEVSGKITLSRPIISYSYLVRGKEALAYANPITTIAAQVAGLKIKENDYLDVSDLNLVLLKGESITQALGLGGEQKNYLKLNR